MAKTADKDKFSLGAFLFLPQWRLSFQGGSHIVPVFMRTLAGMLLQAELIPQDHPALNYGARGVPKYGLFKMLGEAWFSLKTRKANPYQIGIFASIVVMLATIVSVVGVMFFRVVFGLGAQAQAQLFTLAGKATDMESLKALEGRGKNYFFNDFMAERGTGHADYGIFVLDKLFRDAMLGASGKGGVLQQAFGQVMGTYNSVILLIAGIILFWIIVSLVVDTAKTGKVGGGHDMVWGPLRIVFALALMIPLSGSGFSSGQYMIVKLGEWGSNLATNIWNSYIVAVVANESLVAAVKQKSGFPVAKSFVNMWLCRVAQNTYQIQATGSIDPNWEVVRNSAQNKKDNDSSSNDYGFDAWEYSFVSHMSSNACGKLSIVAPRLANNQTRRDRADPSMKRISEVLQIVSTDVIEEYRKLFFETSSLGIESQVDYFARAWACDFVSQYLRGEPGSVPPVLREPEIPSYKGWKPCSQAMSDPIGVGREKYIKGAPLGTCGAGSTPHTQMKLPPNGFDGGVDSCIFPIIAAVEIASMTGVSKAKQKLSQLGIEEIFKDSSQGWAAMGLWSLKLFLINSEMARIGRPESYISVTPGTDGVIGARLRQGESASSRFFNYALHSREYTERATDQENTHAAIINGAVAWWGFYEEASKRTENQGRRNYAVPNSLSSGSGDDDTVGEVLSELSGELLGEDVFNINLVYPEEETTYPMANVIATGARLWDASLSLIIKSTIALAAASGVFGSSIVTAVSGPLGSVLNLVSTVFLAAGFLLLYWVPWMPVIKISFAVLSWLTSVFEAVVMLPVAALSHLSLKGEGLLGQGRNAWITWLNILIRPTLVTIGYIGALLLFSSFVTYSRDLFGYFVGASSDDGVFSRLINSVMRWAIYAVIMYVGLNASFKLIDTIPQAFMKWMNGGHSDHHDDHHGTTQGMVAGFALTRLPSLNPTGAGPAFGNMARGALGSFVGGAKGGLGALASAAKGSQADQKSGSASAAAGISGEASAGGGSASGGSASGSGAAPGSGFSGASGMASTKPPGGGGAKK